MRTSPSAQPSFSLPLSPGDRRLEYELELLTPMVGGGVESWKSDGAKPIREQSIKQQLRFWWRAMQADLPSADLWSLEAAIWGGQDSASLVNVQVTSIRATAPRRIICQGRHTDFSTLVDVGYQQIATGLSYALFPLANQQAGDSFL